MDLREWEKLTPEEQQRLLMRVGVVVLSSMPEEPHIVKSLPREYRKLKEKPSGLVEDKIKAEDDDRQCCSIRDWLLEQLPDEEGATKGYAEKASEFDSLGNVLFAGVLSNISDQEFTHYLILQGMADILTKNCNCSKVETKAPFHLEDK